jgi:S-(hydroxymethyl)glutathione dehydrogenase/alcohol dehydrogenase
LDLKQRITQSKVCHTDLHSIDSPNAEIFPLIFGHEGAGIVESVGENVTSVAVGDCVIPSCMPQCNECENCKNPVNNFCEKLRFTSATQPGVFDDGTTRFSINGKPIYHFMNVASFSEYTVVYERSCCKINPLAPLGKFNI